MATVITFHETKSLSAEFDAGPSSAWLDLAVIDQRGQQLEMTLFFRDQDKAKALAEAINAIFADPRSRDALAEQAAE